HAGLVDLREALGLDHVGCARSHAPNLRPIAERPPHYAKGRSLPVCAMPRSIAAARAAFIPAKIHHSAAADPAGIPNSACSTVTVTTPASPIAKAQDHHQTSSRRCATRTIRRASV